MFAPRFEGFDDVSLNAGFFKNTQASSMKTL